MKENTNPEETENIIIGSGYGGAVAALRLTQTGQKVTMLEMGLNFEKENGRYKPFSNMLLPKNNSEENHRTDDEYGLFQ